MSRQILGTRARAEVAKAWWNAYAIGRLGVYIGPKQREVQAVKIRGRRYARIWWRVLWSRRLMSAPLARWRATRTSNGGYAARVRLRIPGWWRRSESR